MPPAAPAEKMEQTRRKRADARKRADDRKRADAECLWCADDDIGLAASGYPCLLSAYKKNVLGFPP